MNQIYLGVTLSWGVVLLNERAVFVMAMLALLAFVWILYRRWLAFVLEHEDLIQEYARYATLAGEQYEHIEQKIRQQRIQRDLFLIGKRRDA